MKNDIILKKMTSLEHCIDRLEKKRPEKWELFLEDYDLQDIISVNLERAVQLTVDIGLQTLLELNIQPPESMGEVFSLLSREKIISEELSEHLKSAVGFRNIAVHEYEDIDWKIVQSILVHNLADFRHFMKSIFEFEDIDHRSCEP
ncbi:MAG: type VII toxin-antitoxin system HepT family RNase toxin [Spirochaetaceae bacterium]